MPLFGECPVEALGTGERCGPDAGARGDTGGEA